MAAGVEAENKEKVKVSVIVPVYNAEKHLRQCLDSICNQTLREIEIICVDDGSTDTSRSILLDYQSSDNRIQIYQQANMYAGVARNSGMDHATGEYLAFWDSDDFFELDALEKLYNKAEEQNADVVVCGGNRYMEADQQIYPWTPYLNMSRVPKQDTFNKYTNPEHYLDFTDAIAWNKLFRSEYIKRYEFRFLDMRTHEDAGFVIPAIVFADRIAVVDERLVNYRIGKDNLTGTLDKAPLSPLQAWISIAEVLERQDWFDKRVFANRVIGTMNFTLLNLCSWDAYCQFFHALQDYGLKKLHLLPEEEGYYDAVWKAEHVRHLLEDTPEVFYAYILQFVYQQKRDSDGKRNALALQVSDLKKENKSLKKDNQKCVHALESEQRAMKDLVEENKKCQENINRYKADIDNIKSSKSFRIGRAITWLPRKIRDFQYSLSNN